MKIKYRNTLSHALLPTALGCLLLGATAARADAVTYNNSFTLATSNQNIVNGTSGWNVNTGFQGAQWSNTIGGDNYNDPCALGICLGTSGGGVSIQSSGQIGFSASASGSFGQVSASIPYVTALTMTQGTGANGQFTIGSTYQVLGGSSISEKAPSLQASVNGIMNTNNNLSAGVCVLGICSNSSSSVNMNAGNFNILSASSSGTTPLTVFGQPLSSFKYGTTYDLRTPTGNNGIVRPAIGNILVNQLQGGTASTKASQTASSIPTLNLSQTLTKVNVNMTGILEYATGIDNTPSVPISVLTPEIRLGSIADVKGTLVNAQLGATFGLNQSLQVRPDLQVTMVFSAPVYQKVLFNHGQSSTLIDLGTTVTMGAGLKENLTFNGAAGKLLSWSYGMGNAAINATTDLTINPDLSVTAACFSASVFNTFSLGNTCAYSNSAVTSSLISVPMEVSTNHTIGGWNTASFAAPVAAVPEPGSWALFTLGLGGIAWARRQRRQAC